MAYKQKGFPMHSTKSALKQERKRDQVKEFKQSVDNHRFNIERLKEQGMSDEDIKALVSDAIKTEKNMASDADFADYSDKKHFAHINKTDPNLSLEEKIKRSKDMTDKSFGYEKNVSGTRQYDGE